MSAISGTVQHSLPFRNGNRKYEFKMKVIVYRVVWNVASERCDEEFGVAINQALDNASIEHNTLPESGWDGSTITIIPKGSMGLYPWLAENGSMINGGIPQVLYFFFQNCKLLFEIIACTY